MRAEHVKTEHKMHTGPDRYRLVVVVGALLVVMTSVIVGVTVWVVTQQTGEEAAHEPSETVINYVGWEEAEPPESDSRLAAAATPAPAAAEPASAASAQIQATLAQLQPGRPQQPEPGHLQPSDYSQNVADVMKQLQAQQGPRQGGTIQSYGILETYQHDLPPQWPAVPSPNRMGQTFEGAAQPYDPGQAFAGPSGGGWRPQERPRLERPDGPPPGLRPFAAEQEWPPYRRRGDGGERPLRQRRPPAPFRSREANRTRAADSASNAGLDLAVSGWSAFSFGMFLLKKIIQIMGYGGQARMVPDESSLFLRALDIAGKVAGFDATEELAVLGQDLTQGRAAPPPAADSADDGPSRVDVVNGLFRVGLNMVNLYTSETGLDVAECLWGAYCEDLQRRSGSGGVDGIVAKVNSIGLKLIRGDVQEYIGVGQMMEMIRHFEGGQCQKLFPDCNGSAAERFMTGLLGEA